MKGNFFIFHLKQGIFGEQPIRLNFKFSFYNMICFLEILTSELFAFFFKRGLMVENEPDGKRTLE